MLYKFEILTVNQRKIGIYDNEHEPVIQSPTFIAVKIIWQNPPQDVQTRATNLIKHLGTWCKISYKEFKTQAWYLETLYFKSYVEFNSKFMKNLDTLVLLMFVVFAIINKYWCISSCFNSFLWCFDYKNKVLVVLYMQLDYKTNLKKINFLLRTMLWTVSPRATVRISILSATSGRLKDKSNGTLFRTTLEL